MKRIIACVLLIAMVLSLGACGQKTEESSVQSSENPVSSKPEATATATPEATATPAPKLDNVVEFGAKTNLATGQDTLDPASTGKRPVAVMVNNIKDCLPQYGISAADIIYEIPVEYNITRLMAVYGDITKIPSVCTIRSCRYYYPVIAAGYDAKYLHCGIDDTYALPKVDEMGIDNIDAGYDSLGLFGRDQERIDQDYAYEHTMYLDGERLKEVYIENKDFRTDLDDKYKNTWFNFSKTESVPSGTDCTSCVVNFSNEYFSDFDYNTETKTYFKKHSGEPHMDQRSGEQLSFDNLLVLETYIGIMPDDAYGRRQVDVIGENKKGYYISRGKVQEIKWTKTGDFEPMTFTDASGKPLVINQGKTFVGVTTPDTFVVK